MFYISKDYIQYLVFVFLSKKTLNDNRFQRESPQRPTPATIARI